MIENFVKKQGNICRSQGTSATCHAVEHNIKRKKMRERHGGRPPVLGGRPPFLGGVPTAL